MTSQTVCVTHEGQVQILWDITVTFVSLVIVQLNAECNCGVWKGEAGKRRTIVSSVLGAPTLISVMLIHATAGTANLSALSRGVD